MLFNTSRASDADVTAFAEGLLLGYVTSTDDLLEASTVENLADKYLPIWNQLIQYASEQGLHSQQRLCMVSVFRGILHSIGYSSRVAKYLINEFQVRLLGSDAVAVTPAPISDLEFSRMIDSLTIDFVIQHIGDFDEIIYEDADPARFKPLWDTFKTLLQDEELDARTVRRLAKAHHDSLIHLGFSTWKTKQLVLECKKKIINYKS